MFRYKSISNLAAKVSDIYLIDIVYNFDKELPELSLKEYELIFSHSMDDESFFQCCHELRNFLHDAAREKENIGLFTLENIDAYQQWNKNYPRQYANQLLVNINNPQISHIKHIQRLVEAFKELIEVIYRPIVIKGEKKERSVFDVYMSEQ